MDPENMLFRISICEILSDILTGTTSESVVLDPHGCEIREPPHRGRHGAVEAVVREVEELHQRRQAGDVAREECSAEGVVGDVEEVKLGAGFKRGGGERASEVVAAEVEAPEVLELAHGRRIEPGSSRSAKESSVTVPPPPAAQVTPSQLQ